MAYPTTRISLLARLSDLNDHEAWSDFVTLYRPAIYRLARSRGLQDADAQNVTQHVFAAVANKIEDWQPDPQRGRFRTWLARVATNQTINVLRRRLADRGTGGTSMQLHLNEYPQASDEVEELRRQCEREVFRVAARRVRQTFEETTWQAFWMTAVEGIAIKEAATSLAQSVGAVYTARSRVMRSLQAAVKSLSAEELSLSPSTDLQKELS